MELNNSFLNCPGCVIENCHGSSWYVCSASDHGEVGDTEMVQISTIPPRSLPGDGVRMLPDIHGARGLLPLASNYCYLIRKSQV